MSFKTIKDVIYDVISTRCNNGFGYFDVFISYQNKGLSVSKGTKKNKLKIYKRSHHSAKRFYEGMFADKWSHLLSFVPNAYRIQNETMSKDIFEKILYYLLKNHLNPLTKIAKDEIKRDKVNLIKI